jgi:hypothetical protein
VTAATAALLDAEQVAHHASTMVEDTAQLAPDHGGVSVA